MGMSYSNALECPSSAGEIHETVVTNRQHNAYNTSPQPHHASTATRELDDLMASLSDFKVFRVFGGFKRMTL